MVQPVTADDVAAVAALVHTLFRGLDENDDAAVGDCFAETGTWMRQGTLLTGPSEVRAALAKREAGRSTIHVITNIQVLRLADGGLSARYYLTAYVGTEGKASAFAAILDCRDDCVATPLGLRISAKTSRKLAP